MVAELNDPRGKRGESIFEVRLTDFSAFPKPLFDPGFLGDKWPTIDFYVELRNVKGSTPHFLAQVKTTAGNLTDTSENLRISTREQDIRRLLRIPGPTYLFGVHEPTERVFVRSVHKGIPVQAITRIPVSYELTPENLRVLYDEVRTFWKSTGHKPNHSEFS
jgi:hypothetical protein